jgi:hypothetical protein
MNMTRLPMSSNWPKDNLENAALDLDGSMGALIQQSAHEAVALG